MARHIIDVSEDELYSLDCNILKKIISDKTTGENIIWATNDYSHLGDEYTWGKPISISLITGKYSKIIQPRVLKDYETQSIRRREKGEVFTPAWVCNEQNNLIDNAWFKKENIFNYPLQNNWRVNNRRIGFEKTIGHRWQDYVDAIRLEITCGEAPYITSRYDMSTGEFIPLNRRIGLFDRKLRVVNENISKESEWMKWALRALESIYAFEYQGDSLLIARENILYTFIENAEFKLGKKPSNSDIRRASNIISWNIWQMDGTTMSVPSQKPFKVDSSARISNQPIKNNYCKIYDWRSKKTIFFHELMEDITPNERFKKFR